MTVSSSSPLTKLEQALRQNSLVRIIELLGEENPDSHPAVVVQIPDEIPPTLKLLLGPRIE